MRTTFQRGTALLVLTAIAIGHSCASDPPANGKVYRVGVAGGG